MCSGPPITTPQGHCWFLGGEVDSIGPHESQLGRAAAALEEAHAAGLPVAVHAVQ